MSEFIDINESQGQDPLPTVAMNFDGRFIENEIDGYRTLTVSGREVMNYDISTVGDSTSRDGTLLAGKSLPAREITVQYELKANSAQEFQEKFRRLMSVLYSDDDIEIYFNDDIDIVYYGQITAMNEVPNNNNSVISTFVIYCQDPYKYSKDLMIFGGYSNYVDVSDDTGSLSRIPTNPEHIDISSSTFFSTGALSLEIENFGTYPGKKIILNFGNRDIFIYSDQFIRIDIIDNSIGVFMDMGSDREPMPIGGDQGLVKYIDFVNSDFHNFKIKNYDGIQLDSNNSNLVMEIGMRGVWR